MDIFLTLFCVCMQAICSLGDHSTKCHKWALGGVLMLLKADWLHPHDYSTHRQTPRTDNSSSLLFVALSSAVRALTNTRMDRRTDERSLASLSIMKQIVSMFVTYLLYLPQFCLWCLSHPVKDVKQIMIDHPMLCVFTVWLVPCVLDLYIKSSGIICARYPVHECLEMFIVAREWVTLSILWSVCTLLQIFYIQDSFDQCPMPINVNQCRSKSWHSSQCRSIPIVPHWQSLMSNHNYVINTIDWHWSALIGFGHWSKESRT